MTYRLRIAVAWLLLLALPLQGWAAAGMLACGGAHAAQASAGHEHHAHHAAGHPDQQQPAPASCSACAACCVGLALPSQPPLLAEPPAAGVLRALPTLAAVSFVTSGPERPPRSPRA